MNAISPKANWLKNPSTVMSILVLAGFLLIALLAPWIAPYDPYQWRFGKFSLPPAWEQNTSPAGSPEHILGTDRYGRDILSRQIYALRPSVCLILMAVPLTTALGVLIGMVAGYRGGGWDSILMTLCDIIQTLPNIMLMVIVVLIFRSFLAPTWINGLLTLAIGFFSIHWVSLARLIRISTVQLKNQLFFEAAVSIGATPWRIIWHHLLPNLRHIIWVWVINTIPAVIMLEALIGYIGVGVISGTDGGEFVVVSWGGLFYNGRSTINYNPWMIIIPVVCILLLLMSLHSLGAATSGEARVQEKSPG